METLAAASISLASREVGYPLRDSEVREHFAIRKTDFNLNYRFLKRSFKIQVKQPTPQAYVSKYCSSIGLSSDVEARAKDIVSSAGELCGRLAPSNAAVAAIYLVSRISQKYVSRVTGISGDTIRKTHKKLCNELYAKSPPCGKCGHDCLL